MTLIEKFNSFCEASSGKVGAAERGLYVTLLDIWNKLYRPDWFDVSNTQLQRILATGSHNSITRWRNNLEKQGFLESKNMGKGKPLRIHLKELPTTSKSDVPTSENALPSTSENDVLQLPTTSENDVLPRQKVTWGKSKNDVGVRQKMTTSQSTEINKDIQRENKLQSNNEVIAPPEISPPPIPENVLIAYQNKINQTPSGQEKDILAALCADKGNKAVMYGIERAYENDVRSIKYIRGVINNLREGEENGQRHRAHGGGYQETFDPQAERDKWRNETSGWD